MSEILSRGSSREPELSNIDKVRIWTRHVAAETYGQLAAIYYVCPEGVAALAQELDVWSGLVGLLGSLGVGKTNALLALYWGKVPGMKGDRTERVLFKWRGERELYDSLLQEDHELSSEFIQEYAQHLFGALESLPKRRRLSRDTGKYVEFVKYMNRCSERGDHGPTPDIHWAESQIGRSYAKELRRRAWFDILEMKRVILIDTPDYSKTDKRRIDRDLTDISLFWNRLANRSGPSIVVAIQQEMFRDHFFLGKMRKVELVPLSADQMLRAYRLRFDTLEPFAEEALLTLAHMSRGIFRRFKNYLSLTLDLWVSGGRSGRIDPATVRRAVPIERIAEDMELELKPLFPKHSELSVMAVRVLLDLEENGSQKQSDLATKFEMEAFETSRLMNKLESFGYVRRHRDGTDKIVAAINPAERRTAGILST
jgi:hypothetical protein